MIKNAQKDDVSVQFLEKKVICIGYCYSSLNSLRCSTQASEHYVVQ